MKGIQVKRKVKDQAMKKLQKSGVAGKAVVRAGVLKDARNAEGVRVASYAAYNEYGTSRIPSRPFMRSTLREQQGAWLKTLSGALASGYPVQEALELVGTQMVADIQAKIRSGMPPENKPSTKARKARSVIGGSKGAVMVPKTLNDTGALLKSIDYEVVND